ncbi:hypothetical protein C8Q76DRAFT_801310 [Earliella scabrosa]|nr:hypothetical protein C8Q76DRAFT_801310 [Earliella scabrosa]
MASISSADAYSAELQQLVSVVDDLHLVWLSNVAATAWVAYDILVTFSQEVSLVWRARWSIPKVLYFIVRYYTLISLLLTIFGTVLECLPPKPVLIGLLSSRFNTKPIPFMIALIGSLYATHVILGITTVSLVVKSLHIVEGSPLPGCIVGPPEYISLFIAGWSFGLAATCIYFLLILFKFAHNVSLRREPRPSNAVPIAELQVISPLIYSFVRDSAFYFFLVFAGHLLNLCFEIMYQDRALISMSTVWLSAIYSISASRLCLNTRESLQRRRFECDTAWFDDIELHDHLDSPGRSRTHTNLSSRASDGPPVFAHPGAPAIVLQSGGKVSLQRTTFESDARPGERGGRGAPDKRSRKSEEDYELIAVAPWIVMERPADFK